MFVFRTFMIVLSLSNPQHHERGIVWVSGFDENTCHVTREFLRQVGKYQDNDGIYNIDAVSCVREYIDRT